MGKRKRAAAEAARRKRLQIDPDTFRSAATVEEDSINPLLGLIGETEKDSWGLGDSSAQSGVGDWRVVEDPSTGRPYYWNTQSREVTWHRPDSLKPNVGREVARNSPELIGAEEGAAQTTTAQRDKISSFFEGKIAEIARYSASQMPEASVSAVGEASNTLSKKQVSTPSSAGSEVETTNRLIKELDSRLAELSSRDEAIWERVKLVVRWEDWKAGGLSLAFLVGRLQSLHTNILRWEAERSGAVAVAEQRKEAVGETPGGNSTSSVGEGECVSEEEERKILNYVDLCEAELLGDNTVEEDMQWEAVEGPIQCRRSGAVISKAAVVTSGAMSSSVMSSSAVVQDPHKGPGMTRTPLVTPSTSISQASHPPAVSNLSRPSSTTVLQGSTQSHIKRAVTSSTIQNRNMHALMDKWRTVKKEEAIEHAPRVSDPSTLEANRQQKIDRWKREAIKSGSAAYNPNFTPLAGSWRDRVKAAKSSQKSSGT